MAQAYRYPTGARPLLLAETARRKRIESRIVSLLEAADFAEVTLPIIDYAEPYAAIAGADAARQSYRFIDREGELVAIRSDFTPQVARALAPSIATDDLPLRVFYRGDVIRCEPTRLGSNREMFQIGAEIVGDASADADAAVLRLAADVVRAFEVRPVIVFNDVSIAASFDDETRKALVTKGALRNVPTLDTLGDAGSRLRELQALLGDDDAFVLQLDDLDATNGYYTGLRFRVYDAATRTRIAEGGRYDDLYARFGTPAAAVGLTFTIDDLD